MGRGSVWTGLEAAAGAACNVAGESLAVAGLVELSHTPTLPMDVEAHLQCDEHGVVDC